MDKVIDIFIRTLQERFAKEETICDIAQYIKYFAWDCMNQVTFGETLGILEAGNDDRKFLETSDRTLDYFAAISQIPELDLFLDKNPICRIGPPTVAWATIYSLDVYRRRIEQRSKNTRADYLDRFIEARSTHADIANDDMVINWLLSNVLAGSDTTASAMIAAIYCVLKHPRIHYQLLQELKGLDPSSPRCWKECRDMPYLDAVMQETHRLYPGIGLMLERIVPEKGLKLSDGRAIPAGTIVGMNPWVINRNEDVFGPNTDDFAPERWLPQVDENGEEFQSRRNRMKAALFTFGAGSRSCIGRYLSQVESYKMIATIFTNFEVSRRIEIIAFAKAG
ncbi:MAG: hypothetical protein M1820_007504 [Bogoriella megaspora]|nr:MAG: hypothetical protein M1820_007504 [Bogoriella megaspora]